MEVTDHDGDRHFEVDVGPLQFEKLLAENRDVRIRSWGRYGPEEWAENSDDGRKVRQLAKKQLEEEAKERMNW